ncbi:hypothetical protein GW17_00020931 [Ensete ventricosum]|nr:hypothetical protein GW17_00020931 [Ensete ventricosum]
MERKSKRKQREELRIPKEVDKTMADHDVEEEEKMLAGLDAAGDHAGVDEIALDMDGEDLIFAEDTFHSLPDFPCLSSPSPSTLHAKNTVLSPCSSTSSSSYWSFLQVPYGGRVADVQQQPAEAASVDDMMMLAPPKLEFLESGEFSFDGLDILGDVDLLDLSIDPWEPCSLFHDVESSTAVDNGREAIVDRAMQPCQDAEEASSEGHAEGVQQRQQLEDTSSEELARVFLDWLRSNKDSISAEDLRSIKLKRSTIECADRRLGRTKHGRMQLLKLILTWVQNSHLQRKRHRPTSSDDHQAQAFPNNCNCSTADQNPVPWNPNSTDPSAGATHLSLLGAYGIANGDMAYPGATAPYTYPHSCGTSSVVVNSQPFSPTLDFGHPTAGPWPSQLASALPSMVPPQYSGGMLILSWDPLKVLQGTGLSGPIPLRRRTKGTIWPRRRHRLLRLNRSRGLRMVQLRPQRNVRSFLVSLMVADYDLRDRSGCERLMLVQGWKGEKNLKFLLQKVLKQSDVGSLGRIVLPKVSQPGHGLSSKGSGDPPAGAGRKGRDLHSDGGHRDLPGVEHALQMIRGVKVRQPAEAGEPSGRTAEKKAHRRRNGLEKTGGADKMRGNSIIHGDASPSVHG